MQGGSLSTMYPYNSPPVTGAQRQAPPSGVHLPASSTAATHSTTAPKKSWARNKFRQATATIVPSVLACILVQAVAQFFYITTTLTVLGAVQNARDFSDDPSHDGNVLFIVFSVFSAAAAAMCAPMLQNSGYTLIIIGGSVLMMFSTLSSSVVTSAEILVIPLSVFGACAYGLLKTGPQVAMLDFLNNRRGLATGLSYLGVVIGQLAGVMAFSFSDMTDDANYDGSGNARWPNNLRIIEVTAVFALMSAAVIRKPSFTTGSWPELFHYAPFYILCFINFCVSFGFDIINMVYSNLPDERDFREHPSGSHVIFTVSFLSTIVEFLALLLLLFINSHCCKDGGMKKNTVLLCAISAAVVALASYINKPAYKELAPFAIFGCVCGFMRAVIRVCLPLAMITYTGRLNYKIGLPFLEVFGGLGQLLSYVIQDATDMPDDEPLETGWYIAAAFFTVVVPVGLFAHFRYVSWDTHVDETETDKRVANRVSALENAAFTPDDPLDDVNVNVFDMAQP